MLALWAWMNIAIAQPEEGARGARSDIKTFSKEKKNDLNTAVSDSLLTPVFPSKDNISSWEQAVERVRARSTDLKIALADMVRAEAQSRQALALALPQINANVQGVYTLTKPCQVLGTQCIEVGSREALVGNLAINQALFALRSWHGIGTADLNADLTRLSVEEAKRTIALSVANALINVFTAERMAELNRVNLRTALERLELTKRKASLGSANGLDVVRAEQDTQSTKDTLLTGDENLRKAREALGLTLGSASPIGVTSDLDLSGIEKNAIRSCKPLDRLEDRSDLKALQSRTELSRRAITDAKLQFVPTLSLQSQISFSTEYNGINWNLAAILSVPIWDGGARYGSLRDAQAQTEQASSKFEEGKRSALVAVAQATRAIDVATQALSVATQSRDLAFKSDEMNRIAFQEGRGTSLELITAATALRQTEINLVLREFELVKARIARALALGQCDI